MLYVVALVLEHREQWKRVTDKHECDNGNRVEKHRCAGKVGEFGKESPALTSYQTNFH